MLLLIEVDLISKKKSCKRNLIKFSGFSGGKVVFTLLTEVVIFYMELTTIDVRLLGFKSLISGPFFLYLSLKDRLDNFFQVIFGILGSVSKSPRG